jgi:hypothetical protein
MENGKTDKIEAPTLQGVDLWRAIIEENDRRYIQKHILSETSLESSGDESEESDSSSSTSNLSECAAIQRTLELENSFSSDDSLDLSAISISDASLDISTISISDDSLDLSAISISDVKRATCDCCWRFFHAQYVRARTRKSLIALAITGTGKTYLIVDNNTMPLLKECCIEYYDRWL